MAPGLFFIPAITHRQNGSTGLARRDPLAMLLLPSPATRNTPAMRLAHLPLTPASGNISTEMLLAQHEGIPCFSLADDDLAIPLQPALPQARRPLSRAALYFE